MALRFRREPALVGVVRLTVWSSLARAVMVPVGNVRGALSAWALLFKANRQRLDKRYLFIGVVDHFFK